MLESLLPLTQQQNKKLIVLYRIWARIIYSDYVTERTEPEVIRKNTITGIYIPLLDFIACAPDGKPVGLQDLKSKFSEIDSVVNELKDGYLIVYESKSLRLNPYFFQSIQPIIEKMLKELHDEKQHKSSKGDSDALICFRCKKPIQRMYIQIGLSRIQCQNCRSTDIRKKQIDPEQVKKCQNLIAKINRWLGQKSRIQEQIKKNRQNAFKKQKQIIHQKVSKNFFQQLKDKIPSSIVLNQSQQSIINSYYQKDYVQKDYVMKYISSEGSWMKKLQRIRENRR